MLNGSACVIIAYYDDRDGNRDGKVSFAERAAAFISPISIEGMATTEVAMAAKYDMRILQIDPGFANMATQMYLNFARGLILDGIFTVYFKPGISVIGGGIAKKITAGMVKELVVKKGFEAAVKKAFMADAGR